MIFCATYYSSFFSLKKSESQGRTNRATAVHSKKKPANVSMSRQTSAMRTRSGGNPPATSYANLGYEDREEKSEQPTQHRGKRGGRSVNKGKSSGGGRGRRTGGRLVYISKKCTNIFIINYFLTILFYHFVGFV